MPKPAVIDLSHWNVISTNLEAAKLAGIKGVIHKATEGPNQFDAKLAARRSLVRSQNMLWGVYHFIRQGNAKTQVDYFLSVLNRLNCIDDNTLLALDYEDDKVSLDDVCEFMELLERITNRSPVLYSGNTIKEKMGQDNRGNFSRITKYRLWLAQYSDHPTLPHGWLDYFLWQYTDKGVIPGIEGTVDLNQYDGYGQGIDLERLWSGTYKNPSGSQPTSKELLVKVTVPRGVKVVVVTEGEE